MQCPECNSEVKTVPAGVSKRTGLPYNAFEVCSNRECGWKPPRRDGEQPAQKPAQKGFVKATERNGADHRTMIMSYAKDLAIAEITAGLGRTGIEVTLDYYDQLLTAYEMRK